MTVVIQRVCVCYLWSRKRCRAAHGVLHLLRLNVQSFKLALEFVHQTRNLTNENTTP